MKNKNMDLIMEEYWDEKADKYRYNLGKKLSGNLFLINVYTNSNQEGEHRL